MANVNTVYLYTIVVYTSVIVSLNGTKVIKWIPASVFSVCHNVLLKATLFPVCDGVMV